MSLILPTGMSASRIAKDKYGPDLNEFLCGRRTDTFRNVPPTRDEIRRAIQSLSDPRSASCASFKTILTMEWTPISMHLGMLLSESSDSVFMMCINLLRWYCEIEGRGLLDHAYGFLCLQVIALVVRVAILAQVNELQTFLSEASHLPPGQSIAFILHKRMADLEVRAVYDLPQDGMAWLLGWHQSKTGDWTCLPQMGGWTIVEAKFLMERIWAARVEFLRTATWASIFPGWSNLLDVFGSTLVQNCGGVLRHTEEEMPLTPDQRQLWIYLVDILHRYALCSNYFEDDILIPRILACPRFITCWPDFEPRTALDSLDADQIGLAFERKLGSTPRPHIFIVGALVCYTCTNVHNSNHENVASRTLMGGLERAWAELPTCMSHPLEVGQYGDLCFYLSNSLNMLYSMISSSEYQAEIESLLNIATSEELFELLGRAILLPGSLFGGSLNDSEITSKEGTTNLREGVLILGATMKKHIEAKHLIMDMPFIHGWLKAFQGLQIQVFPWSGSDGAKIQNAADWMVSWALFGGALALTPLVLESPDCSYPRCAAPSKTMLIWGCASCQAKPYCSRRCQQADWVYPPNPHKLECGRELGENEQNDG